MTMMITVPLYRCQSVEDADFVAAKRNEAFVLMEYFGYLTREPDEAGFDYWLNMLIQFNGDLEQAEMVRKSSSLANTGSASRGEVAKENSRGLICIRGFLAAVKFKPGFRARLSQPMRLCRRTVRKGSAFPARSLFSFEAAPQPEAQPPVSYSELTVRQSLTALCGGKAAFPVRPGARS